MPRILIVTAPGYEDIELLYPYYRLVEEGFEVVIAAPEKGRIRGKLGYEVEAHLSFDDVKPEEFDALVLPGGRGPERARLHPKAKDIVRHFVDAGKPIAAMCHGPQLLISARAVEGRRLTSFPGIRDDIEVAGGTWVNEPVVVDGNLVTARIPPDIPFWMREFIRILRERFPKP